MGKKKSRRRGKGESEKEVEDFDIGDEEADLKSKYGTIGADDEDFYEDEIDKFHKNEDKILLDKAGGQLLDDDSESEGEKEVLKFDDDDDDDDDDDSDTEMNEMIKIQMNRLKSQGQGLEFDDEDEDDDDEEEEKDGAKTKKKIDDKAGTWGGTKSSAYYGADHMESDESDDEETEDAQKLEYEEAMLIQKRIASKFDDDDFGLDLLRPDASASTADSKSASSDGRLEGLYESPKDEASIRADISKLSKAEKMALLKKESPEFLGLIKDYREKLVELRDRVQPLFDLVKEGKIPSISGGKNVEFSGADYIRLKYKTLTGYCFNLAFYVMLKAKKTSVADHPVVKRLLEYKRTMKQLEPLDEKLEAEIEAILKMVKEGKELKPKKVESTTKEEEEDEEESEEEDEDDDESIEEDEDDELPEELPSFGGGRGGQKRKKSKAEVMPQTSASIRDDVEAKLKKIKKLKTTDLEEEGVKGVSGAAATAAAAAEDKRKATKEMEKNRGLTPHKRKDLKNPRVRLKEKYRKAKIRRKGAVREQRFEAGNYGGEASGIRAGLKKGIKIL